MAQSSGSEELGSLRLGAPISLGKAETPGERGHEAASPQRRVLGGWGAGSQVLGLMTGPGLGRPGQMGTGRSGRGWATWGCW